MPIHKCAECGYLALHDEVSGQLIEATPVIRASGGYLTSVGRPRQAELFCYARKRNFTIGETAGQALMVAAIQDDYDCDNKFTTYLVGRTAKEHEEMTLVEQLRERDRFREAESKADAERRLNEDTRRRTEDVMWRTNVENRANRRFWIGFGVTAFMAVLTSVVIELIKVYMAGR